MMDDDIKTSCKEPDDIQDDWQSFEELPHKEKTSQLEKAGIRLKELPSPTE